MDNIISQVDEFVVYNEVQSNHGRIEDFIDGDLGERLEEYSFYNIVKRFDLRTLDKNEWDVSDEIVKDYEIKIKEMGVESISKIVLSDKKSIIDGIHKLNAFLNLDIFFVSLYIGTNIKT